MDLESLVNPVCGGVEGPMKLPAVYYELDAISTLRDNHGICSFRMNSRSVLPSLCFHLP